ncbi:hypothetical protein NL676_038216 [Syzygium grande]|nr:hypothetical protein NL676_038216 [Syzygium grande]
MINEDHGGGEGETRSYQEEGELRRESTVQQGGFKRRGGDDNDGCTLKSCVSSDLFELDNLASIGVIT